jgi:hypothetical protein
MAREANLAKYGNGLREGVTAFIDALERFEALVRADERDRAMLENAYVQAEREACAKVCDELHWPWHMGDNSGPKECAAAIRARSGDQHTAIKQALAAPVQEPVAWMDKYGEICKEVGEVLSTDTPLYKKDNL